MDSFFSELGREVLQLWKTANFSPPLFPEIAAAALTRSPPAQHVEVGALIRNFLLDDEQPFQTSSGFGQPELVVFDDPRFYIQVLFWLEGTTDIHQHTFSGAFHVLEGSSIHARFAFCEAEAITAHLQIGDLQMRECQLLEAGSTVPIVSGGAQIHSLFHLDTPSLTVVIRTHTDPGTGPQFTYLPPHFAIDPFHEDALTTRRQQLLDVLGQTGDASYADVVREMLSGLDFERGFFILQSACGHLRALGAWDETFAVFEKQHGRLAAGVESTLEEIARRDRLVEFRRSICEPEHRFFLALLLNARAAKDLLALVAQRLPGEPAATILRWAGELCETSPFGTAILDAEFPADLEIPPNEQPALLLAALQYFLARETGGAAAQPSGVPENLIAPLRETFAASALRPLVR